jgi:hypothetical protein
MDKYPQLDVLRKTGAENFHLDGNSLSMDLMSFWQWSASDLVGNAMRGILAEYIVASAINAAQDHRTEWDAYDIKTSDGIKIGVKSAAYIQSWSQKKLSTIQFSIRQTQGWDAETNTYSSQIIRQSDVYVFCVLHHKDQDTIDPLNLTQWTFYVMPTPMLNQAVGAQKTISLSRLKQLKPISVAYGELGMSIFRAAQKIT